MFKNVSTMNIVNKSLVCKVWINFKFTKSVFWFSIYNSSTNIYKPLGAKGI